MSTRYPFTKSKVSNGRCRLECGDMIAIQAPRGPKWEMYAREDGLEIFRCYANAEQAHSFEVLRKDKRDYIVLVVS